MKCEICKSNIKQDEEIHNLKSQICCENCNDLPIQLDIEKKEETNTILSNIVDYQYYGELLGKGEGRDIYDLSSILDYYIIIKNNNDQTIYKEIQYQNFVENLIYFNEGKEFNNILGNIINPYPNNKGLWNNNVFMEKCTVLDESIFTGIDLRDEESYNLLINNDYTLNIEAFKEKIYNTLKENLLYDNIEIEQIKNLELILSISSLYNLYGFINNLDEIQTDKNIKELSKTIELIEEQYIKLFTPKILNVLSEKYGFSGYDLMRGDQWGISYIDYSFKLIDYGDGLNSEKIYNKYK